MKTAFPLAIKKTDIYLEITGFLILLILWGYFLKVYQTLPEIIPVHFNGQGRPDGLGNKEEFYKLPKIATILYLIVTVFTFLPAVLIYLNPVRNKSKVAEYHKLSIALRILKVIILIIFSAITLFWYIKI